MPDGPCSALLRAGRHADDQRRCGVWLDGSCGVAGRFAGVAVIGGDGMHIATVTSGALRQVHYAGHPPDPVRVHAAGRPPATRLLGCVLGLAVLIATVSGALFWCWTQAAGVLELHPMSLPVGDAAHAMWQLLIHGGWSTPYDAFPTAGERASAPGAWAYVTVALGLFALVGRAGWLLHRGVRGWRTGSPLGKDQRTLARRAVDRGWVRQRTWADPSDLRRLWVPSPVSGRRWSSRPSATSTTRPRPTGGASATYRCMTHSATSAAPRSRR